MDVARPKLALPRSRRLRKTRDFEALRKQGRRDVVGCLVANWRQLPMERPSRVGVIASRRIGPAVVRNRAKRVLREVFRLHQHELVHPVEVVLVARASIVGRKRNEVERDFVRVMRRSSLLAQP